MFKFASLLIAAILAIALADTNVTDSTPIPAAAAVVVDASNASNATSNVSIPAAPLANLTAPVAAADDDDHEEISTGKKAVGDDESKSEKPAAKKPVETPAEEPKPAAPVAAPETKPAPAETSVSDENQSAPVVIGDAETTTTTPSAANVTVDITIGRPAQGGEGTLRPMKEAIKDWYRDENGNPLNASSVKTAQAESEKDSASTSSVLMIGALVALLGAAF